MSSTILVADGDASIRALIKDILEARGYEVETASSPASAAALMARRGPALVLAAHGKDEDGGSLVHEAARLGLVTPVILLISAAIDNPGRLARDCGAMAYVQKPVVRAQLEMLARLGLAENELRSTALVQEARLSTAQAFLRSLLDADEGVTFLLDETASVIECSGPLESLLGRDVGECAGRAYPSLFPESVMNLHEGAIAKARTTGEAARLEEHRGGMVLETRVRPVFRGDILSGFVVSLRDITARRRSEVGLAESEKQYRSVFAGATDAIILVDREAGAVMECNDAAARALGYEPGGMRGVSIRGLVAHPEQVLSAMTHGGDRVSYDYLKRRNGTSFPVELSISHFTNAGREVCILYAQDISRRKIVEEALREGARLYRAVVEDQTELICRYGMDGRLTFVNNAFERFAGLDEDEILGREVFDFLGSMDRRALGEWLEHFDPARPVFDREVRQVRSDGEERWISWTHRAVLDDRNRVVEIQAVGRDETEHKAAESALALATEEKEQYRLNLEATFASIPDAILTVDSDLSIITSNNAAKALFGFDEERSRGHRFEEVVGDESNPCVQVLRQVLATDKPVRGYEIELRTPVMGERMVEINCSPLEDRERHHAGAVLIVRDISHIADLEKQLQQRHGFRSIVGRSGPMQDIYQLLEQLSSLDSIVLILGESGTGKELAAEALHHGGVRAGKPLIKVNCSALSESLLESELFGHVRGAFTGAVRDKVGRIQAAQGGTLFLDEIGDISPMLQLKLLRFLESREYERVGESRTYTADVRIIAATNANLRESVRRGAFREDLYYRLNVMPVTMPPLRDRQADIPLLTDHFLGVFADNFGKHFDGVSEEVMDLLLTYSWPGNVREFKHALEHACILSPGKTIEVKHLRKDLVDQIRGQVREPSVQPEPLVPASFAVHKPGREDVLAALVECGGNKVRAARLLGMHRATLYRKLKGWGLDG
ncbi:PAS modulated sigma54 specific transcriptional regulator, Fis family [Pseudodesulfovibrio mercurii]|uniref:PAS modulated sigma54 specific transcriptional regulator, Fis family n=1 Tax=Pseudodesulfovibrio mercurii TaxID=641491 RepID=F0JBD8_9BACT|nr:PAS modulated sigma54 specific transcriptional regulator, Fis family [Pseudodesulfovibrio mercurii]